VNTHNVLWAGFLSCVIFGEAFKPQTSNVSTRIGNTVK